MYIERVKATETTIRIERIQRPASRALPALDLGTSTSGRADEASHHEQSSPKVCRFAEV